MIASLYQRGSSVSPKTSGGILALNPCGVQTRGTTFFTIDHAELLLCRPRLRMSRARLAASARRIHSLVSVRAESSPDGPVRKAVARRPPDGHTREGHRRLRDFEDSTDEGSCPGSRQPPTSN